MTKIGEFELLVLLAILRLEDEPFVLRVRELLEKEAERKVTRGALYRTLDRMEGKGLIGWQLDEEAVPERGGHPRRRLRVTSRGKAAVRDSRRVLGRFFGAVEAVLDR